MASCGERNDIVIGTDVAHDRVVAKLGEGGMGAVYKAFDTRLERFVALKTISTARPLTEQRRLRLIREAKAASALNHPNVVTIYDVLSYDGQFFIAMEFVEGSTLKELISARGLPLAKTFAYAVQVAGALAKTHAAGVVHRDLKPSNIMVTAEGQIKLLDFGLAKLAEVREAASDETATLGLTQEGMALGSVGYMSPEQAEGLHVDARSDIFSFGLVLYEMLTGQRAFQRATKLSTLAALLHESPERLDAHLHDYAPELENFLDRCLHKKPERRFQSMSEVRQALEPLASRADAISSSAASRTPRRPAPSAAPRSPSFPSPISAPIPTISISATAWPRKSSPR